MMHGRERSTSYSIRKEPPEVKYWISFWEQPFFWWLMAKIYHWYDSIIYKAPGFKRLETWLWRHYDKKHNEEDAEFYIPLSNRQDLRCYDLHHKKRSVLRCVEVSKETYDSLKGD